MKKPKRAKQAKKSRDCIQRRGSSWRAQVRLKGEPTQTKTFERKSDATDWVAKTRTEIRAGRALPVTWAKKHTFADLVAEYNAVRIPDYSATEQGKRATRIGWWLEQLGALRVSELTRERLSEAAGRLVTHGGKSGKPASPATRVRYLATLSHVLAYAVERGWLNDNPARARGGVKRPSEPMGRARYLDQYGEPERERLLAACRRSHDSRLYPLVVMALATGARAGELMGLRRGDVDLQKGVAYLHRPARATQHVTKNKERRALPLIPKAVEALRAMPSRIGTDDYIFAGPRGKAAFPRQGWERALAEAGIEDFRFHDLRHTFASYLAMSGATLPELAAALGHKTLAMVQRYAHLSRPHMDGVVRRMGERYLAQA